jgi:SAM-dependent methyltransferase
VTSEVQTYVNAAMTWACQHSDGPVLDVGTGDGFGVRSAEDLGRFAVGIDLEPAAPTWNTPVVLRWEMERLFCLGEVLPISWGLIVFNHSLEHADNYMAALRGAWHILAPGGAVFVAVPAPDSQVWNVPDGTHVTLFTAEFLSRRLTACGFDVIEQRLVEQHVGQPELWAIGRKP